VSFGEIPMRVAVAYAGPEGEALVEVDVPADATVGDAVERSGIVTRLGLFEAVLGYAIFGQRAQRQTPLAPGDRVELLRPLRADPKDARRQRARERPLPPARPRSKRRRASG
jgi:putative ubiquitin-RnfH superfamily antitoxin RatB of RatAB toxin-antitoxin module